MGHRNRLPEDALRCRGHRLHKVPMRNSLTDQSDKHRESWSTEPDDLLKLWCESLDLYEWTVYLYMHICLHICIYTNTYIIDLGAREDIMLDFLNAVSS